MRNSTVISGIVKLGLSCLVGLCMFSPAQASDQISDWNPQLPIAPDHMAEYLVGDALRFEFDGDEVKCGGEISNTKLEAFVEDENYPGVYTATLSTNLTLPVQYCQSEVTKSCEVTVRIEGHQFETLDWICE